MSTNKKKVPKPRKTSTKKKSSKTGAQSLSEYLAGLVKFSNYGSSGVPTLAQLEKMEARLGARFPEILREIYIRYGGIGFGDAEISFDEIKQRLSQFKDYPVSVRGFIPFMWEPDGSFNLVPKNSKPQQDTAVYRYGLNEGMKGPELRFKSVRDLIKWGGQILKQYQEENPEDEDEE